MIKPHQTKPVVLCILDGWGERSETDHNAVALAHTPTWDRLRAQRQTAFLKASELDVGLPAGQMGNSEVGHMNLGAGRVVMQELPRIDQAVADGSLAETEALTSLVENLKATGGTCHLMGLLSPGGVHAHQDHIIALVKILDAAGIPVALHGFLDGRDTPPKSALDYVGTVETDIAETSARIASLCGRYYAMDRDKRWDRVQKAYLMLSAGVGNKAQSTKAAIEASYRDGVTDEFVLPVILGGFSGMQDGDGVLMANFRADRAREILSALADPEFDGFERTHKINFAAVTGLVSYSTTHTRYMTTLFPPQELHNILGSVVSENGLKQLRIAETEKYAHVTFFFNGGREEPFAGEDRILVPSPDVATYDLQPEMSAIEVTDKLVAAIEAHLYDLIIINYANPDMVGHTGILEAAKTAVQTVDSCLARLEKAVADAGGALLVTADHGNAEQMIDPLTGQAHTAHTLNKVPAILIGSNAVLQDGRLADVAPTLLALLGLSQPNDMTGHSLLLEQDKHAGYPASA